MKNGRIAVFIAIFVVICIGILLFLSLFTKGELVIGRPDYLRTQILDQEGHTRDFDFSLLPEEYDFQLGESYLLSFRMPRAEDLPEFYEDGYLGFYPGETEAVLYVDGEEVFRSATREPWFYDQYPSEVHLAVNPDWAGKEMTVLMTPYNEDFIPGGFYFSSLRTDYQAQYAAANVNGFPTGFFMCVFVIMVALFLFSLAQGTPDYSLIILAGVTAFTCVWSLIRQMGYFFLPEPVNTFFDNGWFGLIPAALIAAYLIINWKRRFWRYLSLAVLAGVALVGVGYLVSRATDGNFALLLETFLILFFEGVPSVNWVLEYLVLVCCIISVNHMARTQLTIHGEAQALAVRQSMLLSNYHEMEHSLRETEVLRHEWKNRIASLSILAKQRDLPGLEQTLDQLNGQVNSLSMRQYSMNFAVNVILQNAGSRAAEEGITFNASAPLPVKMGIENDDLCSLLINMLDNAIEAASKAEEGNRRITVSLTLKQGFLAIKCENTYADPIATGENGTILSGKASPKNHGYGITQMRHITEKYGGMLDISWNQGVFTLQTALNLK